jgi:hypothetical protein
MSQRNNLKVAHVILDDEGQKVLAFSKARTNMIPPDMLFQGKDACKIFRDGVSLHGHFGFKLRGLRAKMLESGDRVEVVSVPNFYGRLLAHGESTEGCVVWVDPDLKTALELAQGAQAS